MIGSSELSLMELDLTLLTLKFPFLVWKMKLNFKLCHSWYLPANQIESWFPKSATGSNTVVLYLLIQLTFIKDSMKV